MQQKRQSADTSCSGAAGDHARADHAQPSHSGRAHARQSKGAQPLQSKHKPAGCASAYRVPHQPLHASGEAHSPLQSALDWPARQAPLRAPDPTLPPRSQCCSGAAGDGREREHGGPDEPAEQARPERDADDEEAGAGGRARRARRARRQRRQLGAQPLRSAPEALPAHHLRRAAQPHAKPAQQRSTAGKDASMGGTARRMYAWGQPCRQAPAGVRAGTLHRTEAQPPRGSYACDATPQQIPHSVCASYGQARSAPCQNPGSCIMNGPGASPRCT